MTNVVQAVNAYPPAFAEEWYQQLFKQIETLTRHPTRCPVAPESRKFAEEIRELVSGMGVRTS